MITSTVVSHTGQKFTRTTKVQWSAAVIVVGTDGTESVDQWNKTFAAASKAANGKFNWVHPETIAAVYAVQAI